MRLLVWLSDLVYDAFVFVRNLVVRLGAPRPIYVLLDVSGPYPEHRIKSAWWDRPPQSLDDLRRQLDLLRVNRHVAGVVVTVGALDVGLAALQSLRAALTRYRAAGRRVVAYLPQASTRTYYLASAADTIVMPESGTLDLEGLRLEVTFLGEALARAGISGEFEQFEEYKSAAEPYTRREMSGPMREQMNAILDSAFEDIVGGIAAGRRQDPDRVRALIDRAPLSAGAAREAGLVDGVLYEDELPQYLAAGARRLPMIMPWRLARRRLRQPLRWRIPGRAVAVVSVRGPIQMGESRSRPPLPLPVPLLGGEAAGAATVVRALRAAQRNPLFGAIILAVDSPGGSAIASDLIWREVLRAGQRKPVVAYMGNVAGSGGYYVACAARKIVCQPGTITGSIGVIGGKLNVRALADRAGIHREMLVRGEVAGMTSAFRAFSPEERRRLRTQMEEIYGRFVDRVAAGRGLRREDVFALARGRVWTGRQALERRLVDALGGFPDAVDAAKALMGVAPSRGVPVVVIRPPRAVTVSGRGGPPPASPPAWMSAAWGLFISGAAAGLLAWLCDAWTGGAETARERVLALMAWEISLL